jgi:hypothetical protein
VGRQIGRWVGRQVSACMALRKQSEAFRQLFSVQFPLSKGSKLELSYYREWRPCSLRAPGPTGPLGSTRVTWLTGRTP